MSLSRKCSLLNELIEPFGYYYDMHQDIFSSHINAWQKELGYCAFYDDNAVAMNMVLDCEPIYFDYEGKTWLMELWKGQYGINTGAEIGIYCAHALIPRAARQTTLFYGVPKQYFPYTTLRLTKDCRQLFDISQRHWWNTGFCMGQYSDPAALTLQVAITFPTCEMMMAFLDGLAEANYGHCDYTTCGYTVSLTIETPKAPQPRYLTPLRVSWAQWKNRQFCHLYIWVTKPFFRTSDRLLYLYYFLPFVFRRMLRIRKPRKVRR